MVISASSDKMVNIIDREQVEKDLCHTVVTVQAASKQSFQILEHVNSSNMNEDWKNTINMPPRYAGHPAQLINMLEKFQ